jgi:hypothetical protein
MGGISSRSISFLICAVANASTPGSPAIIAGIGAEGLPTRFKWRWSIFFLLTMSSPQNVKNRRASTPAMRAALARISPGYAMSKLPFEQITLKLRFFSVRESVIGFS